MYSIFINQLLQVNIALTFFVHLGTSDSSFEHPAPGSVYMKSYNVYLRKVKDRQNYQSLPSKIIYRLSAD